MISGKINVLKYRILTLKSALKLEISGIKMSRGRTAYSIIKSEFGFKGNKQKVLSQIESLISDNTKLTKFVENSINV